MGFTASYAKENIDLGFKVHSCYRKKIRGTVASLVDTPFLENHKNSDAVSLCAK